MTRLASTAKMGFFPTPETVTALIANLIALSSTGATSRLLDPCCGEGAAAETLAKAWGLESYGI